MTGKYVLQIVMGLFICVVSTGVAIAEDSTPSRKFIVSGGGGIFVPFEGTTGFSGLAQMLFAVSPHVRLGGEFEFRDYETKLFDVNDVGVQTFNFRAIGMYLFRPEGISPYIGGGLGFSINSFDENRVEQANPAIMVKNDIGLGFGALALLGVEAPLGDRVALFAEGRASADVQVTETEGPGGTSTDYENIGGISGMGGIRVKF